MTSIEAKKTHINQRLKLINNHLRFLHQHPKLFSIVETPGSTKTHNILISRIGELSTVKSNLTIDECILFLDGMHQMWLQS